MGNLPVIYKAKSIDHEFLWGEVEGTLYAHYYEPDIEAARVLYSAVAAHFLPGPLVWPMIVAPPGSMKTELVEALDGVLGVLLIDKLTPNTLLSGQIDDGKVKRTKSPSLLHRIGKNPILVCADFTTVLSMNREARGTILADLRRIYDGRIRSEYGTAENLSEREWTGRLTFVAATTPDVDCHYSMFQTMGERFVMVRMHRPGGMEAAIEAMNQDREAAKRELKHKVNELLRNLEKHDPTVSGELQVRIAALSEFAVRARTHVPRSGYTKEIIYEPEPEAATRLAQQLVQLTKGSALLEGRAEASEGDFEIAKRAAFDSIPANRRKVIDTIIPGTRIEPLTVPKTTLKYALDDLAIQGLVTNGELSRLGFDLLRMAKVL